MLLALRMPSILFYLLGIGILSDKGNCANNGFMEESTNLISKRTIHIRPEFFQVWIKDADKDLVSKMFSEGLLTPAKNHPLGLTISHLNKNRLIVDEINERIKTTLTSLADGLQSQINGELKESSNWGESEAILSLRLKILNAAKPNLENKTHADDYVRTYQSFISTLNLTIPSNYSHELNFDVEYLRILELLTGHDDLFQIPEDPLGPVQSLVQASIAWFHFLTLANKQLSQYIYQWNTSLYNVADLNNWGRGGPQGITIIPDELPIFCRLILIQAEMCPQADLEWLGRLGVVLKNTLQRPDAQYTSNPQDGSLTVRGRYVFMSQIIAYMNTHAINPSFLKISALDTFFIESNLIPLTSKAELSVSIFAANWVVQGNYEIGLHGFDAPDWNPSQAASGGREQDGEPGMAGMPGQTAGNLFGLFSKALVGIQSLTLTAYGGKGGKGQDGGNGGDGPFGSRGGIGHKGGDGGVRGQGGFGGLILIMNPNGSYFYAPPTIDGAMGVPGYGGQGGMAEQGRGPSGQDSVSMKGEQSPLPRMNQTVWAYHLAEFKEHILENMPDPSTKAELQATLSELNCNKVLTSFDTTGSLLYEFLLLEQNFYSLYKVIDLRPSYESLLRRTNVLANATQAQTQLDLPSRKALAYLYTQTLTKLSSLNQGYDKDLIIDLKGFINTVVQRNIEELKKTNKYLYIERQRKEYKSKMDDQVTEAKAYITNMVGPAIDSDLKDLDTDLDDLIKEVKELEKDAEKHRAELLQKQHALKEKALVDRIFSGIKILGVVAGAIATALVGPEGAIVGTAIGTLAGVGEKFALDTIPKPDVHDLVIPQGVIDAFEDMNWGIGNKTEEAIQALEDQMKKMSALAQKNLDELKSMDEKVKGLTEKLEELKRDSTTPSVDKAQKVNTLKKEFDKGMDDQNKELEDKAAKGDSKAAKLKKAFDGFKQVFAVGVQVYNEYKEDEDALKAVAQAIEQTDEEIKRIHEFEENIYTHVGPMLKGMENNIEAMEEGMKTKTLVGLDVASWQVQSTLKNALIQIEAITKGFKVEVKFERTINQLADALTLLIKLYDRIQVLTDKKREADYIANMESPGSADIDMSSSLYKTMVETIDQVIRCNLVLVEWERVTSAFKQWVFPFADASRDLFYLPDSLQDKPGDVNSLVTTALGQIDGISEELARYQTTIGQYSKFIEKGVFNVSGSGAVNAPFYIWSNAEFHSDIAGRLLAGKPVTFQADIQKAGTTKEAIKFNRAELWLKLRDATRQEELNDILNSFSVVMTHGGNSQYSFGDKVYLINTEPQVTSYSFQKGSDGLPVNRNDVYDKIKNGDILLSPFAYWTIIIEPNTRMRITNGRSFDDLKKYAEIGIDVMLVGSGKYVLEENKGSRIPPLHLEEYYEEIPK